MGERQGQNQRMKASADAFRHETAFQPDKGITYSAFGSSLF